MRSRHTLASQTLAGRTRKALRLTRQAARFALSLALLGQLLLLGGAPRATAQVRRTTTVTRPPAPTPTPTPIRGPARQRPANGRASTGSARVASVSKVNFKQMSRLAASSATNARAAAKRRAIHSPGTRPERAAPSRLRKELRTAAGSVSTAGRISGRDSIQTNAPSPSPSQSFLAQEDSPRVGTTTFVLPPDTTGAVGLDKVFTNTNGNYRIHNKLTSAPLVTINAETFWATTGGTDVFDPRVQYDPYNDRWILCIASNPNDHTGGSSILVGVSETSDPQGDYFLYRFAVGVPTGDGTFPGGLWADFPMLGFNKNYIVVSYNAHQTTNNLFLEGEILVFDYAEARAGTLAEGGFIVLDDTFFCVHPATTFSETEETMYLVQHLDSESAAYDLMTITGPATTPLFSFTLGFIRPGGGWEQAIGDIMPQNCVPGSPIPTFDCPGTPRGLEAQDAQVRGNVVFRDGKIWYAQTVGFSDSPGGPIERTAAQWTALNDDGTFFDGGRVLDATATPTNGGKWYAYPSLSVNKQGDMLMGFSEFESDDFVDAGYALRFGTDAAGTMQDPVIYKEGEDYYDKDFGSGRNRWGDYSHTVVDPSNDTDMWTVQEYAGTRVVGVPPDGLQENDSRWSTYWAKLLLNRGAPGDLVISEYRLRGTGGAEDEYVEIYNRTDSPITVQTTDGSTEGYGLAASDGVVRFFIPNGTTIPARGHYLGVNLDGYSLASYPAGTATTATADVGGGYTTDIPDLPSGGAGCTGANVNGRGIALFNTTTVGNFSTDTRFDAVGSVCETNTLYKEGAGHAVLSNISNTESAWVRDSCGKSGNMAAFGPCPSNGAVVDNDNNAADFFFVDTEGLSLGAGQRLGAPGPENLSSPRLIDDQFAGFLLDASKSSAVTPNRVRTQCPTAPECSNPAVAQFGTMELRRRIVNNTGGIVTRLRFRVVDTTTFPAGAGTGRADMRALTSSAQNSVSVTDNATCGALQFPPSSSPSQPCTVKVHGLTLEQSSPTQQPLGGGFNASLSADIVTITPLAPGQSINVNILLGVKVTGNYRFLVTVEALP